MTLRQVLVVLLIATLLVTAVRPARAEALEPTIILMIASAGILVLVVLVYLLVASVESHRHGDRAERAPSVVVLVQRPALASP